jgi:hypothetical protein
LDGFAAHHIPVPAPPLGGVVEVPEPEPEPMLDPDPELEPPLMPDPELEAPAEADPLPGVNTALPEAAIACHTPPNPCPFVWPAVLSPAKR